MLVHCNRKMVAMEVDVRGGVCDNSLAEWASSENGWVQILVVAANIQMRALKTVVERGFM